MIKIAVIGTGIIGINHLEAIKASEKCTLAAVCDTKEDVAKEIGERYNAPYFLDYKDILDNVEVDAVILNLPHFLHAPVSIYFLERGVHVLVEKPMANTKEECETMLLAAEMSGKKLAVGHIQRFFDANIKVKEIINSGELGKFTMYSEVRTIDYFLPSRPAWFLKKDLSGGGIVMNYGAHALDKLFYLLDTDRCEIMSSIGNEKNDIDIEGHAQMMLKFQDGISASVTFSGYFPVGYESIYYFTKGALKVIYSTDLYINKGNDWEKVEVNEDFQSAFNTQLDEFIKYIEGEKSQIADGEYGKAIIDVIDKVYN
ncbi:MAG: Gfo/Idh/MocA family oxidoreductase [Clostridia bacterium]|nr:Gfo/Idh/MocA family oxidoreductase [Clostridia bacterium]